MLPGRELFEPLDGLPQHSLADDTVDRPGSTKRVTDNLRQGWIPVAVSPPSTGSGDREKLTPDGKEIYCLRIYGTHIDLYELCKNETTSSG